MARKATVNPFVLWMLGWIGPLYINLVDRTTRQQVIGQEHLDAIRGREGGFIIAFWHSRILMMVPMRRLHKGRFWFMISEHRDGDLIAQAVKGFDISFARGSTRNPRKTEKKKGGSDALRTLLRALKNGDGVGLTPDGPRGPRQRCQAGVVQLARLSGVPVYPVAYASRRARIFDSWDRFHLPLPFTKGAYVFGAPIMVDGKSDEAMESARLEIESALNHVTTIADETMGHAPSAPAEHQALSRRAAGSLPDR